MARARSLAMGLLLATSSCGRDSALPSPAGASWPEADRLFHQDPLWLGADGRLLEEEAMGGDGAYDQYIYNPAVGLAGGLWSGGVPFGLPTDQRLDEALQPQILSIRVTATRRASPPRSFPTGQTAGSGPVMGSGCRVGPSSSFSRSNGQRQGRGWALRAPGGGSRSSPTPTTTRPDGCHGISIPRQLRSTRSWAAPSSSKAIT